MAAIQKITPNFWFNDQAEEAANYYTSIFKNSSIERITRYGDAGREFHQKPTGAVMTVEFELDGQAFVGLNGGPMFKFTEAISFIVNCDSQDEMDHFWDNLSAGGDPSAQQCGWLKDKFGVSWQIVPTKFIDMVNDPDPAKSQRVMEAMFPMKKLHLATLEKAYNGE